MKKRLDTPLILLSGAAVVFVLAMVAIVLGNIAWNGAGQLSWEFLSAPPRDGMTAGGILPAIAGTTLLVLLMSLAAVPFGVVVAVYFAEYARKESAFYEWTRAAVNNLAGVPSIVFGLFGLGFFVHGFGNLLDRGLYGGRHILEQPSILWGSLTLAALTLPVVTITVEEALRAVPNEYREASLALGATRLQTIVRVVLPQARAGILTGAILAVSRGAGEVAPVIFTGAAFFAPRLPSRANDPFMHLGYHVYVLATQSPDVEKTKPLLYGTVLVLLMLTFLLNLTAVLIRRRVRRWAR
jgi:phosphate transport system permease protein